MLVYQDTLHDELRISFTDKPIEPPQILIKEEDGSAIVYIDNVPLSADKIRNMIPSPENEGTEGQFLSKTATGTKWIDAPGGIAVDDALSTTSVNPVQNKVITNKINELENNIPTDYAKSVNGVLPDESHNIVLNQVQNAVNAENAVKDGLGRNIAETYATRTFIDQIKGIGVKITIVPAMWDDNLSYELPMSTVSAQDYIVITALTEQDERVIDEFGCSSFVVNGKLIFKCDSLPTSPINYQATIIQCLQAYCIVYDLENVNVDSGDGIFVKKDTLKLSAKEGYSLPDSVEVTNCEYSWDKSTGTLELFNPTDTVVVSIYAV